jgi:UDP-N-acetylmuramoylalanine--D-glutamate ligase
MYIKPKPPRLEEQKVLVVGLARSGLASATFLDQKGAHVTVTDQKTETELTDYNTRLPDSIRRRLGSHNLDDFLAAELIILSPGVPTALPEIQVAKKAGIPVWSEVELAFRFLSGKIVGITGSNGKTTTTSLIGEILRNSGYPVSVAGNIGNPLIGSIDTDNPERIHIVELSSFQLENIDTFRCDISVLLNITPDHMDRYSDFSDYAAAKARILENQAHSDFAILNALDPNIRNLVLKTASKPVFFTSEGDLPEGCFTRQDNICFKWADSDPVLFPKNIIRLKGSHNLENCLAAISVAMVLQVSPELIRESLANFSGVEHRLEYVANIAGVDYYNDSKATNVDSVLKALNAFNRPVVAIMGGLDKGTDFSPLVDSVKRRVKAVILIGSAAEKLASALEGAAPIRRADSMENAVFVASDLAESGDTILLSPACASFDMFENFEHRGRTFKQAVYSLNKSMTISHGGGSR